MKLSRIFVGHKRFPLPFFFYHHQLETINQSIKPTVERLSYILHDSSIGRDPYLVTQAPRFRKRIYTLNDVKENEGDRRRGEDDARDAGKKERQQQQRTKRNGPGP